MIAIRRVGHLVSSTLACVAMAAALAAPPRASAEPPRDFPNMGGWATMTDTKPFQMSGRWGWSIGFTTPDGSISCMFSAQASCSGQIPAIPQALPAVGEGNCPYVANSGPTLSEDEPYAFTRSGGSCPPFLSTPLNAGQKLVTPYMSCGVGDAGLVACIDTMHRHGFVIRQSGSAAF